MLPNICSPTVATTQSHRSSVRAHGPSKRVRSRMPLTAYRVTLSSQHKRKTADMTHTEHSATAHLGERLHCHHRERHPLSQERCPLSQLLSAVGGLYWSQIPPAEGRRSADAGDRQPTRVRLTGVKLQPFTLHGKQRRSLSRQDRTRVKLSGYLLGSMVGGGQAGWTDATIEPLRLTRMAPMTGSPCIALIRVG